MAIETIAGLKNTLAGAKTDSWTRSVETGLRGPTEQKTFGQFLAESVGEVNALQNDANVAIQKLASGESKSIHETLLAVEKADIAFRGMNQIRQKVLDAYKEIMRMQV